MPPHTTALLILTHGDAADPHTECRSTLVVDMSDVMRQLGVFPAPGSHGERAIAMMQRLQMKLPRRR
jgi:hypothetical protein